MAAAVSLHLELEVRGGGVLRDPGDERLPADESNSCAARICAGFTRSTA
jgi:hypothetical protein